MAHLSLCAWVVCRLWWLLPEMAKEFLKIHDVNFANRPATSVGKNLLNNSRGVAFGAYGHYWKQMRRIYLVELLSPKRVESMKFVREEEISLLVRTITEESGKDSNPVDISKTLITFTSDIICRMAFGRKYSKEALDNKRFREMIHELFYVLGALDIGDFIPCLGWMDLQGLRRRSKHLQQSLDALFEKIIDEHMEKESLHRDFVDVMLELSEDNSMEIKITRENIKVVIFDMLGAGTGTSATTVEWAMSEMLLNPSMMKKVQDELESVVDLNRMVESSDLPQLEYLKAVVKETLRLTMSLREEEYGNICSALNLVNTKIRTSIYAYA